MVVIWIANGHQLVPRLEWLIFYCFTEWKCHKCFSSETNSTKEGRGKEREIGLTDNNELQGIEFSVWTLIPGCEVGLGNVLNILYFHVDFSM